MGGEGRTSWIAEGGVAGGCCIFQEPVLGGKGGSGLLLQTLPTDQTWLLASSSSDPLLSSVEAPEQEPPQQNPIPPNLQRI